MGDMGASAPNRRMAQRVTHDAGWRWMIVLACFGLVSLVGLPLSAAPESRESYLTRLRQVCEIGCLQPRDLLRAARKRGRGAKNDVAGILDIVSVSRFEDRYRLHTFDDGASVSTKFVGTQPSLNGKPVANSPGDIVIDMDANIMLRLVQSASTAKPDVPEAETIETDSGIVVERFRRPKVTFQTMLALRSMVVDRRVVVRGTPVLTPSLVGARLDHRRSQLTIIIESADDLVILPRYDEGGNPILDGPLVGLGAP